jgi:hypothetical protein
VGTREGKGAQESLRLFAYGQFVVYPANRRFHCPQNLAAASEQKHLCRIGRAAERAPLGSQAIAEPNALDAIAIVLLNWGSLPRRASDDQAGPGYEVPAAIT